MPKKKKYRKAPRTSASKQVWDNYYAHCKEVDRYNAKLKQDEKTKKSTIEKVRKLKASR